MHDKKKPCMICRILNPAAIGFYLLQCVIGTVLASFEVFYTVYLLEDINVSDKWFGKQKQV